MIAAHECGQDAGLLVGDAVEPGRAGRQDADPRRDEDARQGAGERGARAQREPVGRVEDDEHDQRRGGEGDGDARLAGQQRRQHEPPDHQAAEREPHEREEPTPPGDDEH
jgi:hypothetical protein